MVCAPLERGDFFDTLGELALGSRLKRLGDRMVASAAEVYTGEGYAFEPRWFPLLAYLRAFDTTTIGEAARAIGISQPAVSQFTRQLGEAGLVRLEPDPKDRRRKTLSLTGTGRQALRDMQPMWDAVDQIARELCAETGVDFLRVVQRFEAALERKPLAVRVHEALGSGVRIVAYSSAHREAFEEITLGWVGEMFEIEDVDREVVEDPERHIIEPGGQILVAETDDEGPLGVCALQRTGLDELELTKMGVRPAARGRKIGERLLKRSIFEANRAQTKHLYLLTNSRCRAAIRLYEKHGFQHSPSVLETYGKKYARCNVAMRHVG